MLQHELVVDPLEAIANRRSRAADQTAGSTFAVTARRSKLVHGCATAGRAYHFFALRCLRASMPIAWSATIRLRHAFSASSCFIRARSLTSRPPYLAFQFRSVFSWMPCLRQISAVLPVASCSLRIVTIWDSVKRDFHKKGLLVRGSWPQRPQFHLAQNPGATQRTTTRGCRSDQ